VTFFLLEMAAHAFIHRTGICFLYLYDSMDPPLPRKRGRFGYNDELSISKVFESPFSPRRQSNFTGIYNGGVILRER
jgi:hypothetical protein